MLVSTYPCTISGITQQAQHEEEERQAFAAPLPLILDDLWYPRSEVGHCAHISKELGTQRHIRTCCIVFGGLGDPDARLPCDGPAGSADNTDTNNAQRILHPFATVFIDVCDCGKRACPAPTTGD